MFSLFLVVNQGRTEDPAQQEIELTTAPSTIMGHIGANRFVPPKTKQKSLIPVNFNSSLNI